MLGDDQKQATDFERQPDSGVPENSLCFRASADPSRSCFAISVFGFEVPAATRKFHGATLTEAFSPTVAESVNNIRSLGLLLPGRAAPTRQICARWFLVHKNQLSQERPSEVLVAKSITNTFLSVRTNHVPISLTCTPCDVGRNEPGFIAEAVSLTGHPRGLQRSGRGSLHGYSHQGLYPKSAIIRRTRTLESITLDWDVVEDYSHRKFGEPAIETLIEVMDAIITASSGNDG